MKYALVYQGENARLLAVASFSSSPQRRQATLVMSGSAKIVPKEAAALLAQRNAVKTYHTNHPGDVTKLPWREGPGGKNRPVVSSRAKNRARGRAWRPDEAADDRPAKKKREWIDYKAYLQSGKWKAQRQAALNRARHRCQVCNSPGLLDVHHRTYKRLGEELPEDLFVLCRRCHDLFHDNRRLSR